MIVRRALKNSTVVPGGGAIDVCLVVTLSTWMIQQFIEFYADFLCFV